MWTADNPAVTADNPFYTADGGLPIAVSWCVTAVSAGTYAEEYYEPGDVFLILSLLDYSDSTRNYQTQGGEWAPGWMLFVPSTTPLFRAADVAPYPIFPAVDPNRRFVM